MKLEDLKEKKELITMALLAVSVASAVLIVVKVAGFFGTSAKAAETVRQAIDQNKPDAKNLTVQLGRFKKDADALKKQNLFSPPPPRQNPVKAVMGILGDEALINGKWYEPAPKVADATILAVGPTSVTVEWDGKTKVFSPIDSGSSSGPAGPSRSGRPKIVSRGPSSSGKGSPQMVVTKLSAGSKSPSGDSPAAKMKKTYENMSDAQRGIFKRAMEAHTEQYKQMSKEERTTFKARVIERISQSGGRISVELKNR